MTARIVRSLFVMGVLAAPMAVGIGCSHEVAHTETDKPGWFGGNTHEETTVYKNADGTTSVEKEKAKTP
ncbi:MAG: hypothetical protein ACTHM6_09995 [Tepidisphaeraceae bacterium]